MADNDGQQASGQDGAPAADGEQAGEGAGRSALPGGQFDLFKHRGMIVLIAVIALAGGYALVDTFFLLKALPVGGMPKWPFVIMLVLAAGPAAWASRGAPTVERVAMAVFAVAMLCWAVHPAMLRVNSMTGDAVTATYQPTAVGQFEHPGGDYPAIDLRGLGIREYLKDHGDQRPHRFRLIDGGLGFYQLDLWPVYTRTSIFYRQQSEATGS